MADTAFASALDLGALMRAGDASPSEIVEAALRRIDALDGDLGAFVSVDGDRAMADAAAIAADDRRALAGVPIAIKANVAAAGHVMDLGTSVLSDFRPVHDAHVVRRLREAGCVIVGTTRLPELGILPTSEPHSGGPARNPYDRERTPGGSSGGSAAAVAAGMLPMAHGNDGGGSIRIPAACCGLFGLKPSRGRISRGPEQGDSFLVTDGVLSRTVLDTAAALDVMAGYEVGDATWAPPPSEPFVAAAQRPPGTLRVCVTTANPLGQPLDAANERAVLEAADLLESLGHHVERSDPPLPGPETLELFLTVYAGNIGLGAAYAGLLAGRDVTPELEPLSQAFIARAAGTPAVELMSATAMLQAIARQVVTVWSGCDVMVVPALAERPPRIGEIHGSADPPMSAFDRAAAFAPYSALFNVTGQPAMSVPWDVGDDGLPTAVQVVGRPLGEETLLSLATQIEQARPWAERRPPAATAAS